MSIHAAIVRVPLDPQALLDRVGGPEDGAVLLFVGVVRDHADGREVTGMRYEAYEEMAGAVLADIAREAAERSGTDRIAVEHRVGALTVGEASVAIAVSTAHRAEGYDASRYVIEEIKKRLPIWKKERYADGDEGWIDGATPPAPGSREAGKGAG